MKSIVSIVIAAAIGFGAAFFVASNRPQSASDEQLLKAKAAWEKEKADLEAALKEAQIKLANARKGSGQTEVVAVTRKQSPEEILETLKTLRVSQRETRNVRQAIQLFEALIELGPEALPPIKSFLAQQEDIEYDPSIFGSWRGSRDGNVPIDFVFPPSLRFGLFDVVRQIGGDAAEEILSDSLHITGRGVEVAYLTRVLQQLTPFKYRDLALTAAKELLASPTGAGSTSNLDKYEKNYLYGVLAFYNDRSLAQQAQGQLVQSDGKVDKSALQYLEKTMGAEILPAIAQTYQDARLKDGGQKEPLARLALSFAGDNPQADALWKTAIHDQTIPEDARRELVEDLNQDGLTEKNPTESDYRKMRARLELIEKNRPNAESKKMLDAFDEAKKDLLDMLAKAPNQP